MQIIFSSKNMVLTEGLKIFVTRKLQKVQKFASAGLSKIFVNLDVNRKHKGVLEDAVVEIVSDVKHKKIAVKEQGKTFYQAFFSALEKMTRLVKKTKDKSRREMIR